MAGSGIELATAYVRLLPSLQGAQRSIQSQMSKMDFSGSGKLMGKSILSGMSGSIGKADLTGLRNAVAAAELKVQKASEASAESLQKLQIAEARVAEVRKRHADGSSAVLRAEANLASAQKASKAAADTLASSQKALASAHSSLGKAQRTGVQRMKDFASSVTSAKCVSAKMSTALGGIKSAAASVSPAIKDIASSAKDLASSGLGAVESAAGRCSAAFSGMAAAGAAGAAAMAAGIGMLTKGAVDSYASYEQLVGGVDTLFKESSGQVQAYAAEAYRTAGISANDYMEQATSFSATLLRGLGGDTAKAAEYANQAIVDMSDNANKMGTSIESIQWAYQGFAKQNYTIELSPAA